MSVQTTLEHYVEEFARVESQLAGRDRLWIREARKSALDRFVEIGFPSARDENWKYTKIPAIEKHGFQFSETAALRDPLHIPGLNDSIKLVFIDGHFDVQKSSLQNLPVTVELGSLVDALQADEAFLEEHLARYARPRASGFAALSTAFMHDGAAIQLGTGTQLAQPIELIFITSAQRDRYAVHPRVLVVAESGSKATIIERYVALDTSAYFTNAVTEIVLKAGAAIEHIKLQQESSKALHIATLQIQQEESSTLNSHSFSIGAQLARNDINVRLDAPAAQCNLMGLYLGAGKQHVDFHTSVDHLKPDCSSQELYRGILTDRARGVFNGKVIVHQDAQRTDAQQANHNLLLSRHAEVDTKPQLEIFADDVKCSHGATIGQLDDRMLFYLRARGIAEHQAQRMLTHGFAQQIIDSLKHDEIAQEISSIVEEWLPQQSSPSTV